LCLDYSPEEQSRRLAELAAGAEDDVTVLVASYRIPD
jgi:hypothetical protein